MIEKKDEALKIASESIREAPIEVLTDTLWVNNPNSMATVVDELESAIAIIEMIQDPVQKF